MAGCRAGSRSIAEQVGGMLRYAGSVVAAEEEVENQQAAPVCPSYAAILWVLRTPTLEEGQVVAVAPRSEAEPVDAGGGVVEEAEAG